MKKYLKQLFSYIPVALILAPAIIAIFPFIVTGKNFCSTGEYRTFFVSSYLGISILLQISLPIITSIFAWRNGVNTWLNCLFLNIAMFIFHHIAAFPVYTDQGSLPINFFSLSFYIFPYFLLPMFCLSLICAITFSIISIIKKFQTRQFAKVNV